MFDDNLEEANMIYIIKNDSGRYKALYVGYMIRWLMTTGFTFKGKLAEYGSTEEAETAASKLLPNTPNHEGLGNL